MIWWIASQPWIIFTLQLVYAFRLLLWLPACASVKYCKHSIWHGLTFSATLFPQCHPFHSLFTHKSKPLYNFFNILLKQKLFFSFLFRFSFLFLSVFFSLLLCFSIYILYTCMFKCISFFFPIDDLIVPALTSAPSLLPLCSYPYNPMITRICQWLFVKWWRWRLSFISIRNYWSTKRISVCCLCMCMRMRAWMTMLSLSVGGRIQKPAYIQQNNCFHFVKANKPFGKIIK